MLDSRLFDLKSDGDDYLFGMHDFSIPYEHNKRTWEDLAFITVIRCPDFDIVRETIRTIGQLQIINFVKVKKNLIGEINTTIPISRLAEGYVLVPDIRQFIENGKILKQHELQHYLAPEHIVFAILSYADRAQDGAYQFKEVATLASGLKRQLKIGDTVYHDQWNVDTHTYNRVLFSVFVLGAINRTVRTTNISEAFAELKRIQTAGTCRTLFNEFSVHFSRLMSRINPFTLKIIPDEKHGERNVKDKRHEDNEDTFLLNRFNVLTPRDYTINRQQIVPTWKVKRCHNYDRELSESDSFTPTYSGASVDTDYEADILERQLDNDVNSISSNTDEEFNRDDIPRGYKLAHTEIDGWGESDSTGSGTYGISKTPSAPEESEESSSSEEELEEETAIFHFVSDTDNNNNHAVVQYNKQASTAKITDKNPSDYLKVGNKLKTTKQQQKQQGFRPTLDINTSDEDKISIKSEKHTMPIKGKNVEKFETMFPAKIVNIVMDRNEEIEKQYLRNEKPKKFLSGHCAIQAFYEAFVKNNTDEQFKLSIEAYMTVCYEVLSDEVRLNTPNTDINANDIKRYIWYGEWDNNSCSMIIFSLLSRYFGVDIEIVNLTHHYSHLIGSNQPKKVPIYWDHYHFSATPSGGKSDKFIAFMETLISEYQKEIVDDTPKPETKLRAFVECSAAPGTLINYAKEVMPIEMEFIALVYIGGNKPLRYDPLASVRKAAGVAAPTTFPPPVNAGKVVKVIEYRDFKELEQKLAKVLDKYHVQFLINDAGRSVNTEALTDEIAKIVQKLLLLLPPACTVVFKTFGNPARTWELATNFKHITAQSFNPTSSEVYYFMSHINYVDDIIVKTCTKEKLYYNFKQDITNIAWNLLTHSYGIL